MEYIHTDDCQIRSDIAFRLGKIILQYEESIHINDEILQVGDALMLTEETSIVINQAKDCEILLFDLPPRVIPQQATH